jgi:hypothetical protein
MDEIGQFAVHSARQLRQSDQFTNADAACYVKSGRWQTGQHM